MEQEINLLITFLWRVKKLSFSEAELPVAALLAERGILRLEGDNYEILNFQAVTPAFLEEYKKHNAFEDSADFSKSVTLIKELEKNFEGDRYVPQFYRFERELWKVIVLDANKKYGTKFQEYIKTLNKEARYDELYSFIEAYSEVLSDLQLDAKAIYQNTISLQILTESHNGTNHEQPPPILFWGLKMVSENDEAKGKELLQIALNDNPVQANILSSIIAGLYSKERLSFYNQYLTALFEREDVRIPIIDGLSNVRNLTENDVKFFLELIDSVKENPVLYPFIANLLFTILKDENDFAGKEEYVELVFLKIKELIVIEQDELTYRVLQQITFLKGYDRERVETVEFIIKLPHFTLEKFGKVVGGIFLYLRNLSLLKRVLLTIAHHHPFSRISGFFEIGHGRFEKLAYDEMLIEFIANDKAALRFIGMDLFTHHSLRGGYTFDKNILDLEPLQQYKLWVGLTQDYKEPKYSLPALFPLLHSTSSIVKEAFTCKLEEYTQNYGNQPIKIVEGRIDKANNSDLAVLERIKHYHRSFHEENIAPKEHLKELNPFYTHNKLFIKFNKLHSKTFNSRMHKSVEENSFLSSIAKNIQLAKGGGWKFGGRDTISKLGTIESSFSLPRDYFIFPNQFEIEESQVMRTDWEAEDFALIQEIIDSEQQ